MSRPTPWLAPGLNEFQRAAAFFPEIGMQGDPADLAEAFRVHAAELVAAAYEAAVITAKGEGESEWFNPVHAIRALINKETTE